MLATHAVDRHDLGVQHRWAGSSRCATPCSSSRSYDRLAGDLHEPLVGVRAGQQDLAPRRPRSAASQRRSASSSSGTKYAVVMRTRRSAELQQRAEQRGDVAPAGLGRAAHALHDRRRRAWVGRGSGRCRRRTSSGSVSAQLSRKAARSPSTAGPSDAEVRVAPLVLVAGVALPLVGDADAAGERRSPRRRSAPCGASGGSSGRAGTGAAGGTSARATPASLHLVDQRRGPWCGRPRRRAARGPARPPRARVAQRVRRTRVPISPSQ